MSGILRFNTNIPEEISLQRDMGRHVQGRYGEQVMYSLADGRVMYVPPYVEQRIEDLVIAPGEPFEICKTETTDGPPPLDRVARPDDRRTAAAERVSQLPGRRGQRIWICPEPPEW